MYIVKFLKSSRRAQDTKIKVTNNDILGVFLFFSISS